MKNDIENYSSSSAFRIKRFGDVLFIIDTICGIILFMVLFDDYNMMWLYGLLSCVGLIIVGFLTKLLCDCISIMTENQYVQLINYNNN